MIAGHKTSKWSSVGRSHYETTRRNSSTLTATPVPAFFTAVELERCAPNTEWAYFFVTFSFTLPKRCLTRWTEREAALTRGSLCSWGNATRAVLCGSDWVARKANPQCLSTLPKRFSPPTCCSAKRQPEIKLTSALVLRLAPLQSSNCLSAKRKWKLR